MKHKNAVFIPIILFSCFIYGAENKIDVNGGFEKVKAEVDGNLMPENWVRDKKLKSLAGVKIVFGDENVKNGKFALKIKPESNKAPHVYNWFNPIKTQTGEIFQIEISAKGKGTFGIFFYSYAANGTFLGTSAAKNKENKHFISIDSEKWLDDKLEFEVRKIKQKFPELIRVAIVVKPDSDICFDDLKISRTSQNEPMK
jgi:predicted HNH restriction endonuclease